MNPLLKKARLFSRISSLMLVALLGSVSPSVSAELSGKALKIHKEMIRGNPLYDDPKLAEYVSRLGQKMVDASPHAGRKYHFFVTDNPVPNAVTPGYGLVYVHRGLINIMNSEAQLAGVLAHEVGHNVGRHVSRRKTRTYAGNIFANVASFLSGNSSVGQSIALQNQAFLSGFGREMELEADQYAGEFLYNTKYEPEEMLYALSTLADYGKYLGRKGGGGPTYHGAFSTHPRTDKRLQGVIRLAGTLPPGEAYIGRDEFRDVTEGLVYGVNYTGNAPPGLDRYSNETLGITFLYPENWDLTIKGAKIVMKDENKTSQLKITIEKTVDKTTLSKDDLKAKYPKGLKEVGPIHPQANKDLGTIAKQDNQRVALVKVARNTFHFQGIAKNNKITEEQDQYFVGIIKNFRRMTPKDKTDASVMRTYYERLEPGETFASLAKKTAPGKVTEEELRIINGYPPSGEPEPGRWIKLLREVKVQED